MDCFNIIELIRNVILSIVAIITGVVAIIGLNEWKRKYKGQSDYELARRLLVTLFKYRDAINGVRSPGFYNYEMNIPPENKNDKMKLNLLYNMYIV